MAIPRNRVTTLAISFSDALVRRLTTPHSFIRLPSMMVASRGRPLGAMNPPKMVTTIGKTILVVFDAGFVWVNSDMLICRSFSVVSSLIIGGWITGTRDM